jgi:hypothetical protein
MVSDKNYDYHDEYKDDQGLESDEDDVGLLKEARCHPFAMTMSP